MKKMAIGKMLKYRLMLKNPGLRKYLPKTHWLTRKSVFKMLRSYSSVFIKPNHGSGGRGIIRIRRKQNGYEVRYGRKRKIVSRHSLYKMIQSCQKASRKYLVQRGLQLAKYKGSIFDIRVYMQKPHSKWGISGMVARVAAPNHYVTNYHQGGRGKSLEKVLINTLQSNRSKVNATKKQIEKLSYQIAKTLGGRYSHLRELGIDFAIEKNGRIWILEANTRPGYRLFAQLPDKTMIRKIRKNKRLIRK